MNISTTVSDKWFRLHDAIRMAVQGEVEDKTDYNNVFLEVLRNVQDKTFPHTIRYLRWEYISGKQAGQNL